MHTRKERKISREKLSRGLCSAITLARYEEGYRVPDKFMTDALLERMGLIPYQYEFIGSEQEFKYRMMRKQIEKLLQDERTEQALACIEIYQGQIKEKDHLHIQYLLMKRAEIAVSQRQHREAVKLFRKALACTKIQEICREDLSNRLFTAYEINSLYGLAESLYAKGETEEAFCLFEILKNYMDNVQWDKEKWNEVYPHVLYRLAQQEIERHNAGTAYQYLTRAKKLLLQSYSIRNLLEISELHRNLEIKLGVVQDAWQEDFITALKILETGRKGQITEEGLILWESTVKLQLLNTPEQQQG